MAMLWSGHDCQGRGGVVLLTTCLADAPSGTSSVIKAVGLRTGTDTGVRNTALSDADV